MAHTASRTLFTVEGANRALPLVRSIVADIVSEFARMREAVRERRLLEVESAGAPEARERIDAHKADADERAARVDGYSRELNALGVELKDPEKGLVDFPAERGTRSVWLCWRHDEPEVAHWHGVTETCEDRRPTDRRPSGEKRPGGDASR
jgi:hypothetical protein